MRLLVYNCCPHECPLMIKSCKDGLEILVTVKDCCKCSDIRCDSCPKRPDPKCIPGCQELETLLDIRNGCHCKSCKVVCPQLERISCPKWPSPTLPSAAACNSDVLQNLVRRRKSFHLKNAHSPNGQRRTVDVTSK